MLREFCEYVIGWDVIQRTDQKNIITPTSKLGVVGRYVSAVTPRYAPIVLEVSGVVHILRGEVSTGIDQLFLG